MLAKSFNEYDYSHLETFDRRRLARVDEGAKRKKRKCGAKRSNDVDSSGKAPPVSKQVAIQNFQNIIQGLESNITAQQTKVKEHIRKALILNREGKKEQALGEMKLKNQCDKQIKCLQSQIQQCGAMIKTLGIRRRLAIGKLLPRTSKHPFETGTLDDTRSIFQDRRRLGNESDQQSQQRGRCTGRRKQKESTSKLNDQPEDVDQRLKDLQRITESLSLCPELDMNDLKDTGLTLEDLEVNNLTLEVTEDDWKEIGGNDPLLEDAELAELERLYRLKYGDARRRLQVSENSLVLLVPLALTVVFFLKKYLRYLIAKNSDRLLG